MKDFYKSKKGFTLIELLVVVAIIGVLSSLLMSNFVGIRQRARDGQRKADLRQIQSALELYRADNGAYPDTGISVCQSTFSSGSTVYMRSFPCEPLGTGVNSGNYHYSSSDNSTYTLAACLENANDSDGVSNFSAGGWVCSSGVNFVVYNP